MLAGHIQCDGERPKCSICRDRATDCEFDTNATETHTQALKRKFNELQARRSTFEQIYDVLRTRSDKEAEEVFRRIRKGTDATAILRHVNYGDVLVQLALVPEARFRFEFPYLTDMPPYLLCSDNPYLNSELYGSLPRQPANRQQQRLLPEPRNDTGSVYGPDQRDPYLKPYMSAAVVHPWLGSVKPSQWTTVSSDDVLMRKILHDYFLLEYDWFTVFQKDYFLEDMAMENQRFCSPLLVNTLLCHGCVSDCCFVYECVALTTPSSATAGSKTVLSSGIRKASGTSFSPKPSGSSRPSQKPRGLPDTRMTRTGSAKNGSGSSAD